MKLQIKVSDPTQALTKINDVPRQVRYASSLAINDTMLAVQEFTLKELLPEKFTLRAKGQPWQKPGTKFGFNLKFANRNKLESTLGSQADWLNLQERGGSKTGGGGHRVAIPTPAHKPKAEIIPAAKKPRALLKGVLVSAIRAAQKDPTKKGQAKLRKLNRQLKAVGKLSQKPFLSKGKLPPGIFVREGPARLPIKALFVFKEQVPIEIRLAFEPSAAKLAAQLYPVKFEAAFKRAVATARRT